MHRDTGARSHRPALRWLIPVLLAVQLTLAVALGLGWPTPAHAAPPPKLLHLGQLLVYATEDSSEDEPYLIVGGRKVWSGVVDYGNTATVITVSLSHIEPIPFYDTVEVVLKEEDGPFDDDDFLGRNYISASAAEGRTHEAWFREDGASYKLVYALSTAASSFICDGEPGVYLYEHADYRGDCTRFVESSPNIAWSEVGNDRASSVRVVGCYAAYLYEHRAYRGDWTAFSSSDRRLADNRVGNDRVTSVEIVPC